MSEQAVDRALLLSVLRLASFLAVLALISPAAWGIYTMAPVGSSNLIVNPSFEQGSMGPWVLGANYCGVFGDSPCSPWHVSSDESNGGTYSIEDTGDTELLQYFEPVLGVEVTDVSFFVKQEPAEVFGVELFYTTGSTTMIPIFPADTDWNYYDVASSVDPSRMLYGIGFVNYSDQNGNGPMWLDDVVVDPPLPIATREPSCVVLLAFGLLSLVGLAKWREHLSRSHLCSLLC